MPASTKTAQAPLSWTGLLLVTLQLALLLLVINLFQIEAERGFVALTPLLFGGFLVHALLPMRHRLPFFVVLTLAAAILLLGPVAGAWMIAISLALIGLCHLPVAFWLRLVLILAAGLALAALRLGYFQVQWSGVVISVVSAIFMFRLALYLYDLRNEQTPATLWQRLGYFFMLPNLCFPLFPVVHYKTYLRTYYNRPALETYQTGVLWVFRGVMHLLLYRVIYQWTPSIEALPGLGGMFATMVFTYLLYLRVSGLFHLIVGVLCLFGFNLPETHHLYYLASGFSDFWRRINIYWKDFMMQLFFYPSFMALRKRKLGMTWALVVSTLLVFVGTWLLHSYQWFWLLGEFPITWMDGIFWGLLGVAVSINAVYESRKGRSRKLTQRAWSVLESLQVSTKTVLFFILMSVLWSLWNAESLGSWWLLVSKAGQSPLMDYVWGVLLVVLAIGAGVLLQYVVARWGSQPWRPPYLMGASYRIAVLALLMLPSLPMFFKITPQPIKDTIAMVRTNSLNENDVEQMEQGYYETLTRSTTFNSMLWEAKVDDTVFWAPLAELGASRYVEDQLYSSELVPSSTVSFKGATLKTNQWGMRDQEYAQEKPPGTYRVALLGASNVMGSGVANEETAEALLEDRLNAEHAGQRYARYEILNYAVAGYGLHQQVDILNSGRVYAFDPDAAFYVAHPREVWRTLQRFSESYRRGIPDRYPELIAMAQQAGLNEGMGPKEREARLAPYGEDLVRWGYDQLVQLCKAQGITPVWVYWPTLAKNNDVDEEELAYLMQLAREAGFITLTLDRAFEGRDNVSLRIARWDSHANPEGHQLLADQWYEQLVMHDDALGMGLTEATLTSQNQEAGLVH